MFKGIDEVDREGWNTSKMQCIHIAINCVQENGRCFLSNKNRILNPHIPFIQSILVN